MPPVIFQSGRTELYFSITILMFEVKDGSLIGEIKKTGQRVAASHG